MPAKSVRVWVSRDKEKDGSIPFVWGIEPTYFNPGMRRGAVGWHADYNADREALSRLVKPGECAEFEIRRVK